MVKKRKRIQFEGSLSKLCRKSNYVDSQVTLVYFWSTQTWLIHGSLTDDFNEDADRRALPEFLTLVLSTRDYSKNSMKEIARDATRSSKKKTYSLSGLLEIVASLSLSLFLIATFVPSYVDSYAADRYERIAIARWNFAFTTLFESYFWFEWKNDGETFRRNNRRTRVERLEIEKYFTQREQARYTCVASPLFWSPGLKEFITRSRISCR